MRSALGVHCSAQAGAPLSSVLVAVCDSAQGLAVHVRGGPCVLMFVRTAAGSSTTTPGNFIVELGLAFHGMGLGFACLLYVCN